MNPTKKEARIAGAVYLSMVAVGPFSLIYVPHKVIVTGNATATAANIAAHEVLYRLGIIADLIGTLIFILTGLLLYRLFKGVNKAQASFLLAVVLVSSAVGFSNVLCNIAALILVKGADFLNVFSKAQLDALAMLFLRIRGQGNVINEIFWGLWLLPFGILVIRSRFMPRFLGWWLIVGCTTYLALSISSLLNWQHGDVIEKYAMVGQLSEIAVMLWLVVMGIKVPFAATATETRA
jgi:hypothetical protein